MIADTVQVEQRGIAFGFHRAMDHCGAVIGPLIGYLLVVLCRELTLSNTFESFQEYSWLLPYRR